MPYVSRFYQLEVRDEIVREFTDAEGHVDDMMAGLHEIRARLAEEQAKAKPVLSGKDKPGAPRPQQT